MLEEKQTKIEIPLFLEEMLQEQYGSKITKQIIEGYQQKRPTTFRVNLLKNNPPKIEENLKEKHLEFEKVSWNQEAFILKNTTKKQMEELAIYQNGEIYLQSLSSMLPPIFLKPEPGADILDMAAAPGGKTTQMAALSNNKAHITACEKNTIRAKRLKYNLEKQGASCAYVMIKDATQLDDFFSFDQILLDAPCSGSGTLQIKEGKITNTFTPKLIQKSIQAQTTLLEKAIKLLKPGKEMIYSTCSILACENEDILQKILRKQRKERIEIIPIQLEEIPQLPVKIPGTICVAPNELYEGFFMAKIKKWGQG